MSGKSKRTIKPGAGKTVDYDRLSVAESELPCIFHLQSKLDSSIVFEVYGYSILEDEEGPWMGYDPETLLLAPCNHCGQTGNGLKLHVCPGHYANRDSDGNLVVCAWDGIKSDSGEHVCHGKPSLSWHGITRWSRAEWRQYVWKGDETLSKGRIK